MHDRLQKNLSSKSIEEYNQDTFGFGKNSISNLSTFLISDASQWITGSSYVDGGYSAR